MTRGDKAAELFLSGYNCAQAVALAFEDLTGLPRDTAALAMSAFGGGTARMREMCGAVSGMAFVAGMLYGSEDEKDYESKKRLYAIVQRLAGEYRKQNGSIVCRELLSGVNVSGGGEPEKRTAEYYKKRPCPALIKCAADILEEFVEGEGKDIVKAGRGTRD